MRYFFDTFVAILAGVASVAVTLFVIIYVVNLRPYANKSDVAAVAQTASTELAATRTEEKRQDAASAVVAIVVDKNSGKMKNADAEIVRDRAYIADLYKRLAELRKGLTVEQGEIDELRRGR
jgi:Na+-transporting methylmalonyl-CoA/oxaloacetate decarboxylase gamma subunit